MMTLRSYIEHQSAVHTGKGRSYTHLALKFLYRADLDSICNTSQSLSDLQALCMVWRNDTDIIYSCKNRSAPSKRTQYIYSPLVRRRRSAKSVLTCLHLGYLVDIEERG